MSAKKYHFKIYPSEHLQESEIVVEADRVEFLEPKDDSGDSGTYKLHLDDELVGEMDGRWVMAWWTEKL